jgi:FixJ family two-component response regulator
MTPEPTVYIVDDDDAVRGFLCQLVSSVDLKVKAFESAQAFLEGYGSDGPGCLVLDIRMPGMSGLELQQELNRRGIDLPIIVLTGHGNVQVAVHAMKGGAVDFIEKPFNNDLLLDRVQHAVAASLDGYQERARRDEITRRMDRLTPRERQILGLVVGGATNKSMADHLNISDKTVEIHRAKVMDKMEAGSLAELVRMFSLVEDR